MAFDHGACAAGRATQGRAAPPAPVRSDPQLSAEVGNGGAPAAYHHRVTRSAPLLRGLFEFKPAPPDRLRFSLRAGACVGAPVLAGWLAGDIQAGMMVAIGGFTSLYGGGRAYAHRALQLAVIALAFALATALGLWSSAGGWWVALPVIALVAVVATWIGNALRIGPPGA